MSYKGITKEDLETMRKNGLSLAEEQQLYWEKEDYLEVDKNKEIERLNNIINECAEDILKEIQENHHLSCGVALTIRQKLIDYREIKGDGSHE